MPARSDRSQGPPGRAARAPARASARARRYLLAGLGYLLAATPAAAAPDGEWELLGAAGVGHIRVDQRWAPGLQLGAEAQRGLSDVWSLRLGLSSSWHPVKRQELRPGGRVRTLIGSVGVVYALDIFRLVPFGELSVNVFDLSQAVRKPARYVGPEAGLGAIYYLDPRWSLSALVRFTHFGIPLSGGAPFDSAPLMLAAVLRLCRAL